MKRKLLFVATMIASALGGNLYAQFDGAKTYVISNRNDANVFMLDNSTGGIALGAKTPTGYWKLIATSNADCYYVQNAATGKYMQSCNASEVEVAMGDNPVEYCILDCSAGEGVGMYGMASTDQTTYNFTSGTIGCNWKGNNTVQGFAAVSGTNHRSFWKIVEEAMPEPEPEVVLTSPYAGVTPAVGGEYYLYNVKTGKWMGDNHVNTDGTWTSHGELGPRGRDIELKEGNDTGRFILNPKLSNNHSINGSNLYMDTGEGVTNWIFTPVDVQGLTNCYELSTPGGRAMGANADGWATSDPAAISTQGNVWQLVSREQRLAAMQEGDDCSWLVLGGTFPVADSHIGENEYRVWQGNYGSNSIGGDGLKRCNRVWELWGITNRDVYQDIALPNGKYKFKAQAIYVSTGNDGMNVDRYNEYVADPTGNTKGVVYANDKTTPMINVYSLVTNERVSDRNTKEITSGVWAYNGTNEYSTNMFEGKGWTEEIDVVVTAGNLRVGARVEGGSNAWMLIDNFTLTYVEEAGLDDYIAALEQAITDADNFAGNTIATFADALETALNNAKNVDRTDADAMTTVISALETALNNAKAIDVSSPTRFDKNDVGYKVFSGGNGWGDSPVAGLVDNNANTKFGTSNQSDAWAVIVANAPVAVKQYSIVTGADTYNYPSRNPVSWRLEGSNDNQNWTVIDEQVKSYKLQAKNKEEFTFEVNDEATYQIFKFTATQLADGFQMAEFWINEQAHNWGVSTETAATCTAPGKNERTCSDCGAVKSEVLPLADHTYANGVCTVCSAKASEVMLLPTRGDDNTPYYAKFRYADGVSDAEYVDIEEGWANADFDDSAWDELMMPLGSFGPYHTRWVNDYNTFWFRRNFYVENPAEFSKLILKITHDDDCAVFINGNKVWNEFNWTGGENDFRTVEIAPADLVAGNNVLAVYIEQNFGGAYCDFGLEAQVAAPVVISDALYTTFVAPFDVDFTGSDVSAFAAQKNTTYVHLEPVTTVPAGVAVVLKADAAGTYTVPKTTDADLGADNDLIASTGVTSDGTFYALANKSHGVGFYPVQSGVEVRAGKGYLVISSGVKEFYGFNDEADGINTIDNGELTIDNAAIYNLAGQRLNKVQKGINIVNGKKILK